MEDAARNTQLGEIAREAALERSDFLVTATDQLRTFMERHADRLRGLGGLVLIDDDPEYLAVAPDGSFRSRSRYQDEQTGEWLSETEVIESVGELVELYNPADIYAAFAEAAREEAGLAEEPTAAEDLVEVAGLSPEETMAPGVDGVDPYAGAADDWAARRGPEDELPDDDETAARRLYDLALTMQERSQHSEGRLIEEFEMSAASLTSRLGDFIIVDDDDERLTLKSSGSFVAEVVPEEEEGTWRSLNSPEEIVQFYDPTDVFGDLAEALAEAFPEVAGEEGAREDGAEPPGNEDDGPEPSGNGEAPA
jgi:hypothetical protein